MTHSMLRWIFGLALCLGLYHWQQISTLSAADPKQEEATPAKPKRNPYVPRESIVIEDLFEYMSRMQDAPRSVQIEEDFGPAMIICADRMLAKNPDESMRAFALLVKLEAIHRIAQFDNQEYQDKLVALAKETATDKNAGVVRWSKFYLLEQQCLAFEEQKPEALGKLLDAAHTELSKWSAEELDARFLRIASTLTKVINVIPEEERVAKEYKRFGELFAKSEHRDLSRYGKRIAKGIPPKAQNLVGKPMPINGMTHDEKKFDVEQYKGKIVLVDFWATWCGPCRAAMPELISMYDDLHDQGFEIVGVSLDQDRDALKEYIDKESIQWPNIFDADDSIEGRTPLAEKYAVNAIPATYLLDREGKVVANGLRGKALRDKVEELLANKSGKTEPAEKAEKGDK